MRAQSRSNRKGDCDRVSRTTSNTDSASNAGNARNPVLCCVCCWFVVRNGDKQKRTSCRLQIQRRVAPLCTRDSLFSKIHQCLHSGRCFWWVLSIRRQTWTKQTTSAWNANCLANQAWFSMLVKAQSQEWRNSCAGTRKHALSIWNEISNEPAKFTLTQSCQHQSAPGRIRFVRPLAQPDQEGEKCQCCLTS